MPKIIDDGPEKQIEKLDRLPKADAHPQSLSAAFKPRETPLEMKGHTLPPASPETLYQQIIGSQAIEGFGPFHKSAEELMDAVEKAQIIKKSNPDTP